MPLIKTVQEPYTVNNFPSSYISFVHPEAKTIVHGGQIDPAINSLTRRGIEQVVAFEMNQTAAAIGLWKKEAIRQLDWLDYAALLCLMTHMEPFFLDYTVQPPTFEPVAGRYEQLRSEASALNSRIMSTLPAWANLSLKAFFESEHPAKGDNGAMSKLHYLEPSLYDAVRANLDRLEIVVGDVYEMAAFREADIVSLNNTLDYAEGDLGERLASLSTGLKSGARMVLASVNSAEFSDERIRVETYGAGFVRLFDFENRMGGKVVLLSDYLAPFGVQLTSEEIVSDSSIRVRAFGSPVAPFVAAYRNVFTRDMPESGLAQIALAVDEETLRKTFMGIAGRVFSEKRQAELRWEDYWREGQRDAHSLGISPFEPSNAIFIIDTSDSPASLILHWVDDGRIAVPIKVGVEVYKKL